MNEPLKGPRGADRAPVVELRSFRAGAGISPEPAQDDLRGSAEEGMALSERSQSVGTLAAYG